MYRFLWMVKLDTGTVHVLVQAAADITLHILGGKIVGAAALDPYAKALAHQAVMVQGQGLQINIMHILVEMIFYRQDMMDTGNAGKGFTYRRSPGFVFGTHDDVVPM